MKPVGLTSPLTTGPHVKEWQRVLGGANIFKQNFRPGKIDGEYGPGTAGAVARAKWFLGYANKDVSGAAAGDNLARLLSGKSKQPAVYRLRAAKRRRAAVVVKPKPKPKGTAPAPAPAKSMRERALARAKSQLGVVERPAGSNRVLYNTWYRISPGPWCCTFVTWCYVLSGSRVFKRGSKWAYVPYLLHASAQAGSGVTRTADPRPGDCVLFDWQGDGEPDHIGLFVRWTNRRAGTFKSYEGNTGVGNNSNGGKVMERDRNKHNVRAFVKIHR